MIPPAPVWFSTTELASEICTGRTVGDRRNGRQTGQDVHEAQVPAVIARTGITSVGRLRDSFTPGVGWRPLRASSRVWPRQARRGADVCRQEVGPRLSRDVWHKPAPSAGGAVIVALLLRASSHVRPFVARHGANVRPVPGASLRPLSRHRSDPTDRPRRHVARWHHLTLDLRLSLEFRR